MVAFLTRLILVIRGQVRSRASLEAENLVLRQQPSVPNRRSPLRFRLRNIDRLILEWLHRLFPSLLDAIIIVEPETVLRWHDGVSRLLALEVSAAWGKTQDRSRCAQLGPATEPEEPALGRTPHPRRAAYAWYRC